MVLPRRVVCHPHLRRYFRSPPPCSCGRALAKGQVQICKLRQLQQDGTVCAASTIGSYRDAERRTCLHIRCIGVLKPGVVYNRQRALCTANRGTRARRLVHGFHRHRATGFIIICRYTAHAVSPSRSCPENIVAAIHARSGHTEERLGWSR